MGSTFSIRDDVQPTPQRVVGSNGLAQGKRFHNSETNHLERIRDTFGNWKINDAKLVLDIYLGHDNRVHDVAGTNRTVLWPELFQSLETVRQQKEQREVKSKRRTFHPACSGFAMEIDPVTFEKMSKFQAQPGNPSQSEVAKIHFQKPRAESDSEDEEPPEGFVNKNESNIEEKSSSGSAESKANGSEDSLQTNTGELKQSDSKDGSQVAVAATGSSSSDNKESKSTLGDSDSKSTGDVKGLLAGGKDGQNESQIEQPSKGDASLDIKVEGDDEVESDHPSEEVQIALERQKILQRLPAYCDPTQLSPIFFAFSHKSATEQDEQIAQECQTSLDETKVEDKRASAILSEMDRVRGTFEHKFQHVQKQRETKAVKLQRTRANERSKAKKERDAAKKMMGAQEFEHFMRSWQQEELAHQDKCRKEDQQRVKDYFKEDQQRMKEEREELAELATQLETVMKEANTPLGESLVEFATTKQRAALDQVRELRVELAKRQLEYDEAKKTVEASPQNQTNRSMMLVAEAEVKKAAKEVEEATTVLEVRETELDMAKKLRDKENRFIVFFALLASKDAIHAGKDLFAMDVYHLLVLLVSCCSSALDQKIKFLCKAYLKLYPVPIPRKDELVWNEEKLVPQGEQLESRLFSMTRSQVGDLFRRTARAIERLEVLYNSEPASDDHLEDLVHRVFENLHICSPASLPTSCAVSRITVYELQVWIKHTITIAEDLSYLFRVEWKYRAVSQLQKTSIFPVHKYRLGMISLHTMNRFVGKLWVTYREELHPARKLELHERALAMGADDPLKPNYAKFLPKKKNKFFSNAIPLEHKGYGNIQIYHESLALQMAIRLQSNWRAKLGRIASEELRRRRLFDQAHRDALDETRAEVEQKFAVLEAHPAMSMDRMKWDAKVRMKQVKLRAKGKKLERDQVIALMIEQEVAVEQEKTNAHFEEMAIERGFASPGSNSETVNEEVSLAVNLPPPPELTYKQKQRKKRQKAEKIKQEAADEFIVETSLVNAGLDPNEEATYSRDVDIHGNPIADKDNNSSESEEEDTPSSRGERVGSRRRSNKSKRSKKHSKSKRRQSRRNTEIGTNNYEEEEADVKERKQLEMKQKLASEVAKNPMLEDGKPSTKLPEAILDLSTRQNLLRKGADLSLLYFVGLTPGERSTLASLRCPELKSSELMRRLRSLANGMSEKKTFELLQELPSKRLLFRFLSRYRNSNKVLLENELVKHFGLLRRDSAAIARCLLALMDQDLEYGLAKSLVEELVQQCEKPVGAMAMMRNFQVISKIENKLEHTIRTAVLTAEAQAADPTNHDQSVPLDDTEGESVTPDVDQIRQEVELGFAEKLAIDKLVKEDAVRSLRNSILSQMKKLSGAMDELKHIETQWRCFQLREIANMSSCTDAEKSMHHNDDEGAIVEQIDVTIDIDADDSLQLEESNATKQANTPNLHYLEFQKLFTCRDLGLGKESQAKVGNWSHDLSISRLPTITITTRYNWVERCRTLDEMKCSNESETIAKYEGYKALYDDFLTVAKYYGHILIMEKEYPIEQMSFAPLHSRESEVGRGDERRYWKIQNCHFKFASDDDGVFNGSDEYAIKGYSNSIRNLIAFSKCTPKRVRVPLMAAVELYGTVVIVSSNLPIEHVTLDSSGSVKRRDKELLYGTDDRGETIHMSDPTLHQQLGIVAKKLNLAEHGVKGTADLLPRHLYTPVDLRGFRDFDTEEFLVFNFRRLFPGECPDSTPHLVKQPRGHSIFWRQLRPELVQGYKKSALSSDAFTMFSYNSPDWEERCDDVKDATMYLMESVIPGYAQELSSRSTDSLSKLNLRIEMHRRGINMRHLGYLRTFFSFQLWGTFSTKFGAPVILCSRDPTDQIVRGQWIRIRDTRFRVSCDLNRQFGGETMEIPLDQNEGVPQFGSRDQTAYCGIVNDDANSAVVRSALLIEIVSRTAKNVLRMFLRIVSKSVQGSAATRIVQSIIAEYLNLLSGYSGRSSEFWESHMVEGIQYRFGKRSVSLLEQENLRSLVESNLSRIVDYVIQSCGVTIDPHVLDAFHQKPIEYGFHASDVLGYQGSIAHSLHQYVFAEAIILAAKGRSVQNTTYENQVLQLCPEGYWPLNHRIGTRLAMNRGTTGLRLSGQIVNCELAVDGFVKNQWPNRATRFLAKRKSDTEGSEAVRTLNARIEIGYHPAIVPQSRVQPFTVEAWVCPRKGKEGQVQTILMCGRYSLLCSRFAQFRFVLYDSKYGVEVELGLKFCEYAYDEWYHLVGTFDGTNASFYINNQVSEVVDVDHAVRVITRSRHQRIADEEIRRRSEEDAERKNAEHTIRSQAAKYFETKAGELELAAGIQKHISRSEARLKLNKEKAKILGWKKMSKDEARVLVIDEWVKREVQVYIREIAKRHEAQLAKFKEDLLRQVAVAQTRSKVPLKIGSFSSSSSMVGGKNFFVGDQQHIAVYSTCLTRDDVSKHYRIAKTDLEPEADRWLKRATEKFREALDTCHDDDIVLQLYAETMCRQVASDSDRHHKNPTSYISNIRESMEIFESTRNSAGILAVLVALPGEYRFAPLVVDCWDAIQRIDDTFFSHPTGTTTERQFRLSILEQIPERFELDHLHDIQTSPRRAEENRAASQMYQYVLQHAPNFYQKQQVKNGIASTKWIVELTTPSLVCYFASRLRRGDSMRAHNLKGHDFLSREIPIIADNSRALEELNLTNCICLQPSDATVLLERCKFIRKVVLDGCINLDDSVLGVMGDFCIDVKQVSLQRCCNFSDVGVVRMVSKCTNISYLNLSHCELVSDISLMEIAKSLRKLGELHISWCLQISDKGIRRFAEQVNQLKLKVLNLSAVRKVADNAVAAIAEHLLALTDLNLYYCNKVTDIGLLQATHSLHALERLEVSDLYQITDKPFFFDAQLDGRPIANANMLCSLVSLKLGDCNLVTDAAVGEIARRASKLHELSLNGCAKITNKGIQSLVRCAITGNSRGEQLRHLDLTFCIEIDDDAMFLLAQGCPKLESIKISGCSKVTDDGICSVFRSCCGIQYVATAHCRLLTDAFVKCMCDELWVEEVDISYCSRLTDMSLGMIAENLTGVMELNTSWCRKFTDRGLEAICEQNKALTKFTCIACDAFSPEMMERLRDSRPGIEIIH